MSTRPEYIVVIGASAGGLKALAEMILHFQEGIDAAYCIVLHLSREGTGELVRNKICEVTSLTCHLVDTPLSIEKDGLYVAAPGTHAIIAENFIQPDYALAMNGWRPSIDVLFHSASSAYTTKCIGVVLSGFAEDGGSGMRAVKSAGGTTIVQHPDDAEFSFLPQSILDTCEVDHVVTLPEIGALIRLLVTNKFR